MNHNCLNGFYEEGYHYYMEISDGVLTVRDYARRIMLTTDISWDEEALEREGKTEIRLSDNVLSKDVQGEPMTMIKKLVYDRDCLEMDYYYTIMGESHYTLKRVEQGPFDHIQILDDEWLPKLQGQWVNGIEPSEILEIKDDELKIMIDNSILVSAKIHITAQKSYPKLIQICDSDLTKFDFGLYQFITVEPDMLTTRMIVMDARVPLEVFIRPENVGKIELPASVHDPIVSTMTFRGDIAPLIPGPGTFGPQDPSVSDKAPLPQKESESEASGWTCPVCGAHGNTGKFCPECGSPRPL